MDFALREGSARDRLARIRDDITVARIARLRDELSDLRAERRSISLDLSSKKENGEVYHKVTLTGKKNRSVDFDMPSRYLQAKLEIIGQGAFGVVVAARSAESEVAIKRIGTDDHDGEADHHHRRLLREIKIMRHFQHPQILPLLDAFRSAVDSCYLVSPKMDTDLQFIINSKQPISDDHCQWLIAQLVVAVNELHAANVVHRDLKPGNILVNKNCDLKVADFGLARTIPSKGETATGESSELRMSDYVITRPYRPPEVLVESGTYGTPADMWSVGCIFAELLGRRILFHGKDYKQQLQLIVEALGVPSHRDILAVTDQPKAVAFIQAAGKRSPGLAGFPWSERFPKASRSALQLLDKLLAFNPAKRISAAEALRHGYLAAALEELKPAPATGRAFTDTSLEDYEGSALSDALAKEIGTFGRKLRRTTKSPPPQSTPESPPPESPPTGQPPASPTRHTDPMDMPTVRLTLRRCAAGNFGVSFRYSAEEDVLKIAKLSPRPVLPGSALQDDDRDLLSVGDVVTRLNAKPVHGLEQEAVRQLVESSKGTMELVIQRRSMISTPIKWRPPSWPRNHQFAEPQKATNVATKPHHQQEHIGSANPERVPTRVAPSVKLTSTTSGPEALMAEAAEMQRKWLRAAESCTSDGDMSP